MAPRARKTIADSGDFRAKGKRRAITRISCAALILVVLIVASFNFGRYEIPLGEAFGVIANYVACAGDVPLGGDTTVVMFIRLPRILAGVLIGAALALAGAAYQSVFRNPLVSPDILGASAGASLGAAIAIFSGLAGAWVGILAFVCSLGAVFIACAVSRRVKKDPTLALILSGIFVGSLCSAVVSLVKFVADPNDKLPTLTYWLLGSLANTTVDQLAWAVVPIVLAACPLILMRWRMNALSLGENEARALGVDLKRDRAVVIVCATVLTATSIAVGGLIGWVGLVVPHLARMVVGEDNRVVIPATILLGGSFLLLVDDFARTITSLEIPLGVLTAIVGAPFFLALMMRGKGR